MGEYDVVCSKCGKTFDGFVNVPYIKNKIVCDDCLRNFMKQENHWFWPHIPGFCDVSKVELKVFNTKEELLDFLNTIPKNGDILAMSKAERYEHYDSIMTVSKDGTDWWVHGYVKPTECIDLPNWRDFAKFAE